MDEWTPFQQAKPTTDQIEEYMKSLEIEKEQKYDPWDQFHGTIGEWANDYNSVTKPKHYMLFEDLGIEVRDVIEKLVIKINSGGDSPNYRFAPLFISDYVQMMQYLMRFMDKNEKEDLKKARWYLDKMIEAY